METKKQEAIRLAWEKCIGYEKAKSLFKRGLINHVGFASDKYGLLFGKYFMNRDFEHMQTTRENGFVRPKSLSGIEDNNGWTSILSEEDLPKEKTYFYFYTKKGEIVTALFYTNKDYVETYLETYSHYQPIIKPEKPIF